MQGVTTEVVGNCGMSAAPVDPARLELLRSYVDFLCERGLAWNWTGFGDYLDRLQRRGVGVNVACLVGHNTVRTTVMGFDRRAPTPSELEEMRGLISRSMSEGAFGFSSGLIYVPGVFATTSELIELSGAASEHGGIYATHIRSEGEGLIDSVKEAIAIGEGARIPVEISHMKASGRRHWGKVVDALKLIDEAGARGLDVTFDAYPYTAGMTTMTALLPLWALEGGVGELLKRLRDPVARGRMAAEMRGGLQDLSRDMVSDGGKGVLVAQCKTAKNKALEGKSILEISGMRGTDAVETVLALLGEEDGDVSMISFSMCEDDVRRALGHARGMIGTDSIDVSKGRPHPRAYGTYPRVLARYVREEGLFTVGEAVRKMTSMPALKLGLRDRGLLREGYWADVMAFGMDSIQDMATFAEPAKFPRGIHYVLVNGQVVVEEGRLLRKLAGRVLRRGRAPS
jgi:N-acyl-D-aspartate/D-glutamate deacylase